MVRHRLIPAARTGLGAEMHYGLVMTEEIVIFVATLVASGLLMLGVVDLVWPAQSRRRYRRATARAGTARPETVGRDPGPEVLPNFLLRESGERPRDVGSNVEAESGPLPAMSPVSAPIRVDIEQPLAPPVPPERGAVPSPEPLPRSAATTVLPIDAETSDDAVSFLDRCSALLAKGDFELILTLADSGAFGHRGAEVANVEGVADKLWIIVAGARKSLGDDKGAQAALDVVAAEPEGSGEQRYRLAVASIGLTATVALLARSQATFDGNSELAFLARARRALELCQRELGDQAAVAALAADVETAYASTCETIAQSLVRKRDFDEARRFIGDTLTDVQLPTRSREVLTALLSESLSAEIGQLTAAGIRDMHQGGQIDALRAFERAEELLLNPKVPLPAGRGADLGERLRRAYTRLGIFRLEAGDFEEAFDPLARALRVVADEPERGDETRAAVVRALEGVVERQGPAIRELLEAGHRADARAQADKLHVLLDGSRKLGVTEAALDEVRVTVERLLEDLETG